MTDLQIPVTELPLLLPLFLLRYGNLKAYFNAQTSAGKARVYQPPGEGSLCLHVTSHLFCLCFTDERRTRCRSTSNIESYELTSASCRVFEHLKSFDLCRGSSDIESRWNYTKYDFDGSWFNYCNTDFQDFNVIKSLQNKGRSRISMVWVPPLGFDPYCEGKWLPLQDEFTPSINSKKQFLQKL